jgi:hypothetical protein
MEKNLPPHPNPTQNEKNQGRTLWAKHMGLKQGAIGNNLGKHIGNLGNIKVTCWEQRKNEKNPPPPPQRKNQGQS